MLAPDQQDGTNPRMQQGNEEATRARNALGHGVNSAVPHPQDDARQMIAKSRAEHKAALYVAIQLRTLAQATARPRHTQSFSRGAIETKEVEEAESCRG